jgi:hypothetical protein
MPQEVMLFVINLMVISLQYSHLYILVINFSFDYSINLISSENISIYISDYYIVILTSTNDHILPNLQSKAIIFYLSNIQQYDSVILYYIETQIPIFDLHIHNHSITLLNKILIKSLHYY